MIRTVFGSEVTIIGGDLDSGAIKVRYEDGEERTRYLQELTADSGYAEITDALKQCSPALVGGRMREAGG